MSARTAHSFRQGCHLLVTRQYACLVYIPTALEIYPPSPSPSAPRNQTAVWTTDLRPPFRRPSYRNLHGTGAVTRLPEPDATPVVSGFVLTSPPPTSTLPVQVAAKQISSGHGETRGPGHAQTVSRSRPQGKPHRLLWPCPVPLSLLPYQSMYHYLRAVQWHLRSVARDEFQPSPPV